MNTSASGESGVSGVRRGTGRALRLLSVVLSLLAVALLLASCGNRLTGTYARSGKIVKLEMETALRFHGNKVTATVTTRLPGQDGVKESFTGRYSIKGGQITMTFDTSDDDAYDLDGTFDFKKGREDGKAYIEIEHIRYFKKK